TRRGGRSVAPRWIIISLWWRIQGPISQKAEISIGVGSWDGNDHSLDQLNLLAPTRATLSIRNSDIPELRIVSPASVYVCVDELGKHRVPGSPPRVRGPSERKDSSVQPAAVARKSPATAHSDRLSVPCVTVHDARRTCATLLVASTFTPGWPWRSFDTPTSRSPWRSTARRRRRLPARRCAGLGSGWTDELLYFAAVQDQKGPVSAWETGPDLRRDGGI